MKDRIGDLERMIQINDSFEDVVDTRIHLPEIRRRRNPRGLFNRFTRNTEDILASGSSRVNQVSSDSTFASTSNANQSSLNDESKYKTIRRNINLIAESIVNLKNLHNNILSNSARIPRNSNKLDEVTIKIENLINTVIEEIKMIENKIIENVDGISEDELKILEKQCAILSREFFKVMNEYNAEEANFKERLSQVQNSNESRIEHLSETGSSHSGNNSQLFLEDFFKEVNFINYILNLILESIKNIKMLHSTLFLSPTHDPVVKISLDEVTVEFESLANIVLQRLLTIKNDIQNAGISEEKLLIQKSQLKVLSSKFVEALMNFSTVKTFYHERNKQRIQHQFDIAGKKVSDEQLEEMVESGNSGVFIFGFISDLNYFEEINARIEARRREFALSNQDKERYLLYLKLQLFCIQHTETN